MTVKLVATIKWGLAAEPPPEPLPEAFAQARALWAQKDPRAFEIVGRFLECFFLPGEVMGDVTELFDLDPADELQAERLEVFGVDFGDGPLPSVRATATFELAPKDPGLTQARLDAWEEANDFLDTAVSFQWAIGDYADGLVIHRGLSFAVDDGPSGGDADDGAADDGDDEGDEEPSEEST